MAAKTIVTFHPDVACDLCGRRLLRGERPDVFLGGGQRRTVCELCGPRATHEGWRREVEEQVAGPRAQHPQRGRSLLGRLRQLREPVRAPGTAGAELARESSAAPRVEWAGIESEWTAADEDWADVSGGGPAPPGSAGDGEEHTAELGYAPGDGSPAVEARGATVAGLDTKAELRRALEIFNAAEPPRRVAGVTRSLGPACVHAALVPGSSGRIAIVVAWELCWYRYEIDLDDESAGVAIAAEGMELEELAAEDRAANATADEHGMLSLL